MTNPLVTVVMNCFNGEAFLRQAIESVIAQTWSNWEIVFWDNQSTDGSAEIAQSYHDPRIRYFHAPQHTLLYEGRNHALAQAAGDLVAFLDVDDWWLPEKLERQVALFADPEVGIVYANFWVENQRKGLRWLAHANRLPEGRILDELLKRYRIGLLTVMLRRAALPRLTHPFDPRYHIIGDFDLVIRMAAEWKVACAHAPLAVYRIHGNNETARRIERHIQELGTWLSEMSGHEVIGSSPNFCAVATHAKYISAMNELLQGRRNSALEHFLCMPWGRLRLRLAAALLMPAVLVAKFKN